MFMTVVSIDFNRMRSSWRLCISSLANEATHGARTSPRNPDRSISAFHSACSEIETRTAMSFVSSFGGASSFGFSVFFLMACCYTNRFSAATPMVSCVRKKRLRGTKSNLEQLIETVYTLAQQGFTQRSCMRGKSLRPILKHENRDFLCGQLPTWRSRFSFWVYENVKRKNL